MSHSAVPLRRIRHATVTCLLAIASALVVLSGSAGVAFTAPAVPASSPPVVPSYPVPFVRVSEVTQTTALVTWGGSDVSNTLYRLEIRAQDGSIVPWTNAGGSGMSARVAGLLPGTGYRADILESYPFLSEWHLARSASFTTLPVSTTPTTPATPTTPPSTTPTTPTTPPSTTPTTPNTPTTPRSTTPDPTTPEPELGPSFGVAGTATLASLVKGTLPLSGVIQNTQVTGAAGAFSGQLSFSPTQGRLVALGFLPVVAKVDLVASAPLSGTLRSGALDVNQVVRIKLPSVTLFGIQLAGGANCAAAKPTNLALRSTEAGFSLAGGGTLAGSFSISNLTGCGGLTGLVSPITASKGNAIVLRLGPAG